MSAPAAKRSNANVKPAPTADRFRIAAFLVIIGLVAARPLMAETFERVDVSFIQDTDTGPTPASTVWMDTLLLAASAVNDDSAVAALRSPVISPRARVRRFREGHLTGKTWAE